MTFIGFETEQTTNKQEQLITRKITRLKCDTCGKEFVKVSWKSVYKTNRHHFCTCECSRIACLKGGLIDDAKRQNCLARYGTDHHLKNAEVQEKRLQTVVERYGGRSPLCDETVKEKSRSTCIEKYGDHFSRTESVKEKKRRTCTDKFGVDSFSKTQEFKDKVDWQSIHKKGNETRKKRGKSVVSKIEIAFLTFLRENFPVVDHQVPIATWLIDFYIPSVDAYVQFDGNYWHGLDRPHEIIMMSDRRVDKVIASTIKRDEKRAKWFEDRKFRLVRIKESDFKQKQYDVILEAIRGLQA